MNQLVFSAVRKISFRNARGSLLPVVALFVVVPALSSQTWSCGTSQVLKGDVTLTADTVYKPSSAGWDFQKRPTKINRYGCTSGSSFFFSIPLPEGNYEVRVVLGGERTSETTVKAEARRAMLVSIKTAAGKYRVEHFSVNVRRPQIAGGGEVRRKPREVGSLDWDEKLTLEFAGSAPALRRVEVRPASAKTSTIYIAGDSTVTDQDREPWSAWGQMLPAFFGAGVAIADNAESGETLRSFVGENRFAKIFSVIKPGDYLLMQFGHNDQKPGQGYVPPDQYAGLLRKYIEMARSAGATPILVTPMNRRTFDLDGHVADTLAPYPETVREVAIEQKVPLVDLNSMSKTLYEAVGEQDSRKLFVYAAANTFPGQNEALHDDTHFNSYGAWELARCVVLVFQQHALPLKRFLREPDIQFDPHRPDASADVQIPTTPFVEIQKPYER